MIIKENKKQHQMQCCLPEIFLKACIIWNEDCQVVILDFFINNCISVYFYTKHVPYLYISSLLHLRHQNKMLHSKIDNLLLKPAILKSSTSKSRNSMNNFHSNLPSNCLDNSTDPKHNVYAKKSTK